MKKFTIEEMRRIAKSRSGECLSKEYYGNKVHLLWSCKEGHKWTANPSHVKMGSWCPFCARNKRLTIDEMRKIAKNREGICLSKKYVNAETKLLWECKEGHKWRATPHSIKDEGWCPICAVHGLTKLTIKDMQEIAKTQKGKCLSKKYVNSYSKLLWQCQRGHKWKAVSYSIKRGIWCPICAGRYQTIKDMQRLARIKEGKCLSAKYHGTCTKLLWECKEGHKWKAIPRSIKRGTWCSICSQNVSERICRRYFEIIFKKEFPKTRPSWLRSPKGIPMELDGYCEKIGLAFEYQGKQHYSKGYFSKTTKHLNSMKERDELKKTLCKKNNVKLIEIPYKVDYEKMPAYIKQEAKKRKINFPQIILYLNYKHFNICSDNKLKEMQELAKKRGGKCLSKKYIHNNSKLLWRCKEGHEWETNSHHIKQGTWCPICIDNSRKLSINEMQEIAKNRKGKCLSKKYIGTHHNLLWQCNKMHKFKASPNHIKRGQWCHICTINKKKMNQYDRLKKTQG